MEDRQFKAMVSNLTGCAVGISDFLWNATVRASCESDATELAIKLATLANKEHGLPPHGIRLTEDEIRHYLVVLPDGDSA